MDALLVQASLLLAGLALCAVFAVIDFRARRFAWGSAGLVAGGLLLIALSMLPSIWTRSGHVTVVLLDPNKR